MLFSVAAAPVTQVVVVTGDPAPDGDGSFDLSLGVDVALNNNGWVAFRALLDNATNGRFRGIFVGNGAIVLQIARTSDPLFEGTIGDPNEPAINDAGQTLFRSHLAGLRSNFSLIRSETSPPGGFTESIAGDAASPDNNGMLVPQGLQPLFNNNGQAAFIAALTNTSGGSNDDTGIFRSTAGALTKIAREGETVPNGNGKFGEFTAVRASGPAMNNSGQVAFFAGLLNTSGGNADSLALFRGDGSTLTQIARSNDALPGGGTLVSFGSDTAPDINDSGVVVFPISTSGGSGHDAIFKGSGGALTVVARSGGAIPGSADVYSVFNGYARINKSGRVGFLASVFHTGNPSFGYSALLSVSSSSLVVAKDGQAAPGGGTFTDISGARYDINDSGQFAFYTCVDANPNDNTPCDTKGIFFFDGNQLVQVVRLGDALLGSTVTDLSFAGTGQVVGSGSLSPTALVRPERSGLNNAGQVAYGFTLADNRGGVAIWSPTSTPTGLKFAPAEGISRTQTGILVKFRDRPGHHYVVQRIDDLLSPPWINCSSILTGDDHGRFQFEDDSNPLPAHRFYRAVEVQ